MRLQGKTAIVTGAGQGIGRTIAVMFGAEGANVVIADFVAEYGEQTAGIIRDAGGHALFVKVDITKTDEVKKMVQEALDHFGRIDILVNNAGIFRPGTGFDFTEADWDKNMNVNLKGGCFCTREASGIMLKQKKGKVINIASICGMAERSAIGNLPYTVSKAGVIGMTRSLAVILGPHINVNAIAPGFIDAGQGKLEPAEYKEKARLEAPLKRLGSAEDIGHAAIFLASDESDFITGEILTVSGGRAMR